MVHFLGKTLNCSLHVGSVYKYSHLICARVGVNNALSVLPMRLVTIFWIIPVSSVGYNAWTSNTILWSDVPSSPINSQHRVNAESENWSMREYMINSLDTILRGRTDCGVILTGDFNQFKDNFLRTHYGYEQLVKTATRNFGLVVHARFRAFTTTNDNYHCDSVLSVAKQKTMASLVGSQYH